MFELIQPTLRDVLADAHDGKLQLPDFQRGWVWEEDGIRSLLASIVRSFPVGALLSLKTGGPTRFAPRVVEGAPEATGEPEELLLDGQQRVTSLYQSLVRGEPVNTQTAKGKKRDVFFFIDIAKALEDPFPEDAVEVVDKSLIVTRDIGRTIELDLRTSENRFDAMRFPVSEAFEPDTYFNGWMQHWGYDTDKIKLFQEFRSKVLEPIRTYKMPMIRLARETTKEAVCLVFEKVNTGGKKLDAFELLTAMFAADGAVNLRGDWYGEKTATDPKRKDGRAKRLQKTDVLRSIDRTDFLRAISLVSTFETRQKARQAGKTGKDLPAVSCTHAALLDIQASAYERWADPVTQGFERAAQFMHGRGIFWWKDVPYPSQMTVLAALQALRGNMPFSAAEAKRIETWFWCGVFGELYGSSTDTRLANDVEDLTRWLDDETATPRTVATAYFSESRLDTLYTRLSAAYKGLHALLIGSGARDFLTADPIGVANYFAEKFDIHHIFPRAWCEAQGVPRERYNTVVNKTVISARTNRKIGGRAPSVYSTTLDADTSAAGVPLNDLLLGHRIDAAALRADDFDGFYAARKAALLDLIETAMGKVAMRDGVGDPTEYDEDFQEEADVA